jgi:hypothetical protein
VTKTNYDCIVNYYQLYQNCFVIKAQWRTMDADVAVNYHLFLVGMVVKDGGFAKSKICG